MRALIAAGGEPPTPGQAEKYADAQLIIAADSGADWLYGYGIMPHVFLGDMDSVSHAVREYYSRKGVKMLKYPSEKNATDTMIAAEYALDAGADEIVLLGGGGGRQDHTYANYQAMAYIARRGVKAVMPCGESVCHELFGSRAGRAGGSDAFHIAFWRRRPRYIAGRRVEISGERFAPACVLS